MMTRMTTQQSKSDYRSTYPRLYLEVVLVDTADIAMICMLIFILQKTKRKQAYILQTNSKLSYFDSSRLRDECSLGFIVDVLMGWTLLVLALVKSWWCEVLDSGIDHSLVWGIEYPALPYSVTVFYYSCEMKKKSGESYCSFSSIPSPTATYE